MSNVTPLEIAGIVARVFDLDPKSLSTRMAGNYKEWPRPLAARSLAVRLIMAHTTATKVSILNLFGIARSGGYRVLEEADQRLSAEIKADPELRDLVVKVEREIDALHESREEAREAELRRRAADDAKRSYARGKAAGQGART